MNKRSVPGLKLNQSPLVLVLTQIRFPAVLRIDKHIPDIQESLRELGLTRFNQEESQQVIFGPEVKTNASTRWVFSNRKQDEAVVLANNFFVYEVSQYDVFDTFVERLLTVLKPIYETAKLSFSDQIGVRYVDLLRGNESHTIDSLVCESLRGLTADQLGMKAANHQFVIQGPTEHGILWLRSFENTGEQFLPPDLQTEHLKHAVHTSKDDKFRVLDFDHIARAEIDFVEDDLRSKLWDLHEHTDRAFRAAVTKEARANWGDESV